MKIFHSNASYILVSIYIHFFLFPTNLFILIIKFVNLFNLNTHSNYILNYSFITIILKFFIPNNLYEFFFSNYFQLFFFLKLNLLFRLKILVVHYLVKKNFIQVNFLTNYTMTV